LAIQLSGAMLAVRSAKRPLLSPSIIVNSAAAIGFLPREPCVPVAKPDL
jgi:hypothetical protein